MASVLRTKLEASRTALQALVVGVAGVGPVYPYIRNVNLEATVQEILKDTAGRYHFWQLGISADAPEALRWQGGECTRVRANFDVHGYLAVNDLAKPPSELVFEGLVADVLSALDSDSGRTLGGLALSAGPVSRLQGGHVILTSVLCHYARIIVPCEFVI